MKNPLIGERLKHYRKACKLSVEQVSELLSEIQPVAPKTIYGWESGRTQPDADTLLRLCRIYEVNDILESFSYKTSRKNVFKLTPQEKLLIEEYRKHPNMQGAIQKLLDID